MTRLPTIRRKAPATLAELLGQCRQSIAECDEQAGKIDAFVGALPPLTAEQKEAAKRGRARMRGESLLPLKADYPLTEADKANIFASNKMMMNAAIAVKLGKNTKPYYRAAGEHLRRLKDGPLGKEGPHDQAEFKRIVRGECHHYRYRGWNEKAAEGEFEEFELSPRRAYELIAIASGKTSFEEYRTRDSARHQKSRKPKDIPGKTGRPMESKTTIMGKSVEEKANKINVTHKEKDGG